MHLTHLGLSPTPGHAGFEEVELGKDGKTLHEFQLLPRPASPLLRMQLLR